MAWAVIPSSQIRRFADLWCRAAVLSFLLWPSEGRAAVFYPQTFTLGNGMEVVIVQNRLSPAVAQMVWYKAGAIDDPPGRSGLAHYLEHMMFKGTKNVPDGAYSKIIAAMGGDENAYTTHNYTAYHVVVAADKLAQVMQLEADRMRNLDIDSKLAASELSVVINERLQRTENTPQGLFAERLAEALFPEHLYGRPVIGHAADIKAITPADADSFYKGHYTPNNAILVISGNVEVKDVLRIASATFGAIEPQNNPKRPSLSMVRLPFATRVEMQDARVTQPVFTQRVVVPSRGQDPASSYAMEVLEEILSADEVGLLDRHFVIDKKIAAGISASYNPVTLGPSVFSLSATPSPGQDIRGLERSLYAYMRALAKRGVTEKDLRAAKQRLIDSAVFARDRLMAPAEILGASMASGLSVEEVENWPQRIQAVSLDQVNASLRKIAASKHQVTGILEPVSVAGEWR